MIRPNPDSKVDILILGAGWTSQFLIPLLKQSNVSYAATSTTGHDDTIPFRFDPSSTSPSPYKPLPHATTILITFPLVGEGQSKLLTDLYHQTHQPATDNTSTSTSSLPHWIQLGSTGIFTSPTWNDVTSPIDTASPRATAEAELLSCVPHSTILHLAGLYGGTTRDPKNWLVRVAKSKAQLKGKQALHLVHGEDVARAVLAAHRRWEAVEGKRWIVTDLRVYDWWDLGMAWGEEARRREVEKGTEGAEGLLFEEWIGELMVEEGVRALPRDGEGLGEEA